MHDVNACLLQLVRIVYCQVVGGSSHGLPILAFFSYFFMLIFFARQF